MRTVGSGQPAIELSQSYKMESEMESNTATAYSESQTEFPSQRLDDGS
jgi:hypothetical protein